MSDEYIVEAHKINKTYEKINIIKNISLQIKKNEFAIIFGKSGSGKTTLLSLLSGLEQPDSGEIILDGENIEKLSEEKLSQTRRQKIGFIFQSFNLIPTLTALQNVMLPLLPVSSKKKLLKEKALEIMKYIEIDNRIDHLPSKLSGGERQRVAIARALINNPKILFADEPTGNLDSSTGKNVIELLIKLKIEKGVSILLVTHDSEYEKIADKIIKIKDGVIENEN